MVYHLQVQANSNRYGELIESDSSFSEVYSNLEKTIEQGKNWLKQKIQYIYENSNYCTNEANSLTIKDMFDDNKIFYSFKIVEVDPEYADNFEVPNHEYECKNLKPTHTVYYYDLEGKLLYKDLEYRYPYSYSGYVISIYPEDEKIGDVI